MTTNTSTTPTLANFTPQMVNAMKPETRAAAAQQLINAGHDRALVEKTFGAGNVVATIAGKADQPLSTAEREKLAQVEHLRKHWTGSPQELETALKQSGVELAAPDADKRTSTEKAFDSNFPKTDKSDYRLNYHGHNLGDVEAVAAIHDGVSTAFAEMQLPIAAGQGLLDALVKSADEYGDLQDDIARQHYGEKQNQLAERAGRDLGDRKEISRLAAVALRKIADRDFVKELAESGSLESAAVVVQLALQGHRLEQREKLAAKRK